MNETQALAMDCEENRINVERILQLSTEHISDEVLKEIQERMNAVAEKFEEELVQQHGMKHTPPHPYHTHEHSALVARSSADLLRMYRIDSIYRLFDLTYDDYETCSDKLGMARIAQFVGIMQSYAGLLAFGHDIVQNSHVSDDGFIVRSRGIKEGGNEYESALRILNEIDQAFPKGSCHRIVLDALGINEDRIKRDIYATYPDIESDVEVPGPDNLRGVRIEQRQIGHASTIGKIIAISDIYSPYYFKEKDIDIVNVAKWSNAEFWERNQDLLQKACEIYAYLDSENMASLPQEMQAALEAIIDEVKTWWEKQIGFAYHLNNSINSYVLSSQDGVLNEDDKAILAKFYKNRHVLVLPLFSEFKNNLEYIVSGYENNKRNPKSHVYNLLCLLGFDDLGLSNYALRAKMSD